MAKAYKCDRCNKLYSTPSTLATQGRFTEFDDINNVDLRYRFYVNVKDTEFEPDLCETCAQDVVSAIAALIDPLKPDPSD